MIVPTIQAGTEIPVFFPQWRGLMRSRWPGLLSTFRTRHRIYLLLCLRSPNRPAEASSRRLHVHHSLVTDIPIMRWVLREGTVGDKIKKLISDWSNNRARFVVRHMSSTVSNGNSPIDKWPWSVCRSENTVCIVNYWYRLVCPVMGHSVPSCLIVSW